MYVIFVLYVQLYPLMTAILFKQNYKRKYCVKRTQNAVAVHNLNRDFSLKLSIGLK